MGYGAFVCCNCYQQGLTTTPPYPELVVSDEEGVYLQFPEGLWERNQKLFLEMDAAFDNWKAHACAHPDLKAASEHLANMSGMAAFRRIVQERGGAARFPVLAEHLPQGMGGSLAASYAPALQQEVNLLAAEPGHEKLAVLREQPSGELIFSVNNTTQAIFAFGADGHQFLLGKFGFTIVRKRHYGLAHNMAPQFQSRHFRQQCLAENQYRFTDITTGTQYDCSLGLQSTDFSAADATFCVALETAALAQEYEYILAPLRKLVAAASHTSNPICWS